jgi:hypothetical protein
MDINEVEKSITDNHQDLMHKIFHANISAGSSETFTLNSKHKMDYKMLGQI